MVKKVFFRLMVVITGLLLQINLWAQTSLTLNVETEGTLPTLIDSNQKDEITDLTLTGSLNGTDILFIREMAGKDVYGSDTNGKLTNLNLSGANIVYGGDYYYRYGFQWYSYDYTSINTISEYMFYNCKKLTSLTIPDNVTSIGYYAFQNCIGLTSITIPNSVTSIGVSAFDGCTGLTSVIIGNSVTSIYASVFSGCIGLTNVTIPNSVTLIGISAFAGCRNLTSVTIGNSVTRIGANAFENCIGLTSFTIPNSVTSIDQWAFSGCTGLTSITIPNSVTWIGPSAFSGCTGLTNITIPNSVTSIGDSSFAGCTGLTEIYTKNPTPPSVDIYVFNGVNKKTCKLYVPKGSAVAYKDAWGFDNVIEMDFTDITAINPINKDKIKIQSVANGIVVETKEQTPVSVYNLSGYKVYQSVINGNTEIRLNKGVYIVNVNNESEKVIIK